MENTIDYVVKAITHGMVRYSGKTQRYYSNIDGRFISNERVRKAQEEYTFSNAIDWGKILCR